MKPRAPGRKRRPIRPHPVATAAKAHWGGAGRRGASPRRLRGREGGKIAGLRRRQVVALKRVLPRAAARLHPARNGIDRNLDIHLDNRYFAPLILAPHAISRALKMAVTGADQGLSSVRPERFPRAGAGRAEARGGARRNSGWLAALPVPFRRPWRRRMIVETERARGPFREGATSTVPCGAGGHGF